MIIPLNRLSYKQIFYKGGFKKIEDITKSESEPKNYLKIIEHKSMEIEQIEYDFL